MCDAVHTQRPGGNKLAGLLKPRFRGLFRTASMPRTHMHRPDDDHQLRLNQLADGAASRPQRTYRDALGRPRGLAARLGVRRALGIDEPMSLAERVYDSSVGCRERQCGEVMPRALLAVL